MLAGGENDFQIVPEIRQTILLFEGCEREERKKICITVFGMLISSPSLAPDKYFDLERGTNQTFTTSNPVKYKSDRLRGWTQWKQKNKKKKRTWFAGLKCMHILNIYTHITNTWNLLVPLGAAKCLWFVFALCLVFLLFLFILHLSRVFIILLPPSYSILLFALVCHRIEVHTYQLPRSMLTHSINGNRL